ncbi:MAG: fructose-1,6-bisphosphatase [Lachnospiraceae bacterium]|nr:fructose-1,6-bisphosphatase [Lachnospiraceae bacterium]
MEDFTKLEYLHLLAEKFPTEQQVCAEIINLSAILNLPKATEYFMSDLHGEYEAFHHILNNCSGVIREKVHMVFDGKLSEEEQKDLCTLIYYPEEKLSRLRKEHRVNRDWYWRTIRQLIEVTRVVASKYSRSKVRKAMPDAYRYIMDEMLHAQPDESSSQSLYHEKIIDTIIELDSGDAMIYAFADVIKRLSVDHLHIVGDIFDRGPRPDTILDYLMGHHSVDIEWGNHDILWMGAAAGSEACIATVVRNSLSYKNTQVLENGYGITLRPLTVAAEKLYPDFEDPLDAAYYAISIILFKLEEQIILRNPRFEMDENLYLDRIDYRLGEIEIDGEWYDLKYKYFQTIQPDRPWVLSDGEKQIMAQLRADFVSSEKLAAHIRFLYEKGSLYLKYNGNLLFHGCIPMNEDGSFSEFHAGEDFPGNSAYAIMTGRANSSNGGSATGVEDTVNSIFPGKKNVYSGKALMDYADRMARLAYFGERTTEQLDYMWYLWCGYESPLSGRRTKTFARMFLENDALREEPRNAYFLLHDSEEICQKILAEFGLNPDEGHIINGHTPIHAGKGESPVKANGKLIVIDGGFCKRYQKETGIAGYTFIFNSHGLRLLIHQPFSSMEKSIEENLDIETESENIATFPARMYVRDVDIGVTLKHQILRLRELLEAYRTGLIAPGR